MMHRSLIYTLLITLLAACGGKQGEVVIQGHFANLRQADFFIYSLDNGTPAIDTTHVRSGRFEYIAPVSAPAVFHLVYPHFAEQIIFASGGDIIEIEGDAANLRDVTVEGSKDNEDYTALRASMNAASGEAAADSVAAAYIAANPESNVARFLRQQLKQRADHLPVIRKGGLLPDFALRNDTSGIDSLGGKPIAPRLINADSITNATLKGHETLIAFTAAWVADGYICMDNLRTAMRMDDSLRVIICALDIDYREFARVMRGDSVTDIKYRKRCAAYCDRLGLRTHLVSQWRIHELPYYIIVDSVGKVAECGTAIPDKRLKERREHTFATWMLSHGGHSRQEAQRTPGVQEKRRQKEQ